MHKGKSQIEGIHDNENLVKFMLSDDYDVDITGTAFFRSGYGL